MSTKKGSTIAPKPTLDPNLSAWIGGAANKNQPEPEPQAPQAEPASQQASLPASRHASLEPTRMLSVRVPADLHQRLRVHAVSQDRQIQDIVTELLQSYLDNPNPA